MGYRLSSLPRASKALERLLHAQGLRMDEHLEYTLGAYDESGALAATGSLAGSTIRCLAVDAAHQGEGLMNLIVGGLVEEEARRGRTHLFLYTKPRHIALFEDLGFYPIAQTPQTAFLENRRNGFEDYLRSLLSARTDGEGAAALVINANPFTLGHRHLVERACAHSARVHLFVVTEDLSEVPFEARYAMVRAGTADLKNLMLHETKSYMISSATFPSYFLSDDEQAVRAQARLDIEVFVRIARTLGIGTRYAGEEPISRVTAAYNEVMAERLPLSGIEFRLIPRKEMDGAPISASRVRALIRAGRIEEIRPLVPETTYAYLTSARGAPAIARIQGFSAFSPPR